jgi:hypothetical protein
MICLYDVHNVARAVRDNVDAGPASQAVIEQSRVTFRANLLAKLLRGVIAVARIYVRALGLLASDVEIVA